MHRIRLLGLLIFLYYTTFVVIRKVMELDEPAAAAELVKKSKKKKRLTVDLEALLDKLRMIDGVKRLEVLGQV